MSYRFSKWKLKSSSDQHEIKRRIMKTRQKSWPIKCCTTASLNFCKLLLLHQTNETYPFINCSQYQTPLDLLSLTSHLPTWVGDHAQNYQHLWPLLAAKEPEFFKCMVRIDADLVHKSQDEKSFLCGKLVTIEKILWPQPIFPFDL